MSRQSLRKNPRASAEEQRVVRSFNEGLEEEHGNEFDKCTCFVRDETITIIATWRTDSDNSIV